MAAKKKSLGRGLDKLLSTPVDKALDNNNNSEMRLSKIAVSALQPGIYQPRMEMDAAALEELANSIRTQGVLQPIVVRSLSPDNSKYEIIAGERRWRAAQLAGLKEVPAVVHNTSDKETMAIALIENIQREDLNPMEEANAVQRLIEDFSMTHQEVATSLGKSRTSVSNLLRLMSLRPEVKDLLARGELEFSHAKVLLALEGAQQVDAARIVAERALSVRETEDLVRRMQSPSKQTKDRVPVPLKVDEWQQRLSERLGVAVKIDHKAKGKGKVVINYNDISELEAILAQIEEEALA